MNDDILKNYGAALADLLSEYARQITAEAGHNATGELLERIGNGEAPVVIVSQLVPFSVVAYTLDETGQPGAKLFDLTRGGMH